MHKLESLELVGFKSFCDKTSILFNDQITSIVGPNGCGKSNVADAISWVLGEQRPRSLRGEKMEDVIFNGTVARKPLGFVEAALTLKPVKALNVPDDGIPVDNISVARRLYRSGESEYLINNRRCRLLDIHQTFEGTGLGFTSYAIIEQGRIGSILTSKPMERRSLIEEAAKIITFKQRKKSAEIKLELAHQNLLRIHDIIGEIERQLRSLKRQAGRAHAFARLREEMRSFHRVKLHRDYRRLRADVDQLHVELQASQAEENAAVESQRAAEQSVQQANLRHAELMRQLEECREQLAATALELEKNIQTRQSQQQQILMMHSQVETLRQDIAEGERRLSEIRGQFQAKGCLREDLERELSAIRARMDQFRAEHRDVQRQIDRLEERLDQVRHYSLEEVGQKATLKNQRAQIEADLASLEAREARVLGDREKLSRRSADLQQAEAAALDRCRQIQQQIERHAQRERELEQAFSEALNLESAAEAELLALRERRSGYQHRLTSIEEIEVRRANYSEGVQKFLTFIQQRKSLRSSGTLADHVETDPEYEALVETFLDKELEFVLVEGLSDAASGLQQLRESRAGKCTFLAIASENGFSGNGNGHPETDLTRGIIGTLGNLLRMEEPVRKAFYRALPQYANAVVVQDIGQAQRLGEQYPESVFVTLAGEAWTQRGVISGIGESSHTSGLLALKREKRELIACVDGLQRQIQDAQDRLGRAGEERTRLGQEQKDQRGEIHRQEKELISAQHEYNRLLADLQREEQAARVFNNELEQMRFDRGKLREESGRIDLELDQLSQTGIDREREFGRVQENLTALRARGQELGRLLSENHSDLAAKLERKHGADQEWTRLTEEEAHWAGRWQREREQCDALVSRIEELQSSNQQLETRAVQSSSRRLALESTLNRRKAEAVVLEKEQQGTLETLEQAHRAKESAMERRMQLEVTLARLGSDLDHMRMHCLDEFGVPLEELAAPVPQGWQERSCEDVKAEFERLKVKVEEFGPINMSALEEYRENEERFSFLTRQREDIERSIADTQQAIQEINKHSRDQFLEAFEAINTHFKSTFQLLFGGGECGMQLLDEADTLESGIDIFAQPPGKKLQNIMLLSGGEKALIAFALLIAIFKYRPSPFCVLDEVDAPLDEANIARFTHLVRHMSELTQFIIITHNKRTMEISRSIYGITMEEPGVSQVVSVNFN
ncbi:MAG: chromosome segregation protein SMC [Acidobacteria bacterium]|nr:chromosome segregation protein SMC [Acidobacteriota bacterium]